MARIFLKLPSLLMPSVLKTGTLPNRYSITQHEGHGSIWHRRSLIQTALGGWFCWWLLLKEAATLVLLFWRQKQCLKYYFFSLVSIEVWSCSSFVFWRCQSIACLTSKEAKGQNHWSRHLTALIGNFFTSIAILHDANSICCIVYKLL